MLAYSSLSNREGEIKMAKRIALVFMVAVITSGLCDAMYIFDYEWKDEISLEKLNRHLTEERFHSDATEVARLLAITRNKRASYPQGSGGNSVYDLLILAKRSDKHLIEMCDAKHFGKFKKTCDSLSGPTGNARLLNYCNHCYWAHFEFCADERLVLFSNVVKNFEPITRLSTISRQISQYIVTDGEEDEPEENNISKFMRKLANRDSVTKNCADLVDTVKKTLLFFDEHDEETTKFLDEMEKGEYTHSRSIGMIYKRCAIITRLATK